MFHTFVVVSQTVLRVVLDGCDRGERDRTDRTAIVEIHWTILDDEGASQSQ